MAAQNWYQKWLTNPITTNLAGDLLYFARSPYGASSDSIIDWDSFAAQFTLSGLTSAHFFVGNASNVAVGVAMSGDAALANTGAVTVTKTNGTPFAPSATTDTTNAANISSGTLPSARLVGVYSGVTGLATQAQTLNMGGFGITNLLDPVNAQDAATKNYVNSIAAGLNPVDGVLAASTANLNATYANGTAGIGATLTDASGTFAAFVLDGYTASVGDRILSKDQTTTYQNGIYTLTTNGDGVSVPWVLTRATDYNTPAQIAKGDLISVLNGTVNKISSWYQTATVVTIGTSAITFSVWFNPASYISSSLTQNDILAGNGSNIAAATTLTALMDTVFGNAQGNILYRNSTAWTVLAPGTANFILATGGASANPSWAPVPSATLPSGTMFNLQSTTLTTANSFLGNATWVAVTGLSVTITPTSSSNSVLVRASINYSLATNLYYHGFRIVRGATPIGVATSVGSTVAAGQIVYANAADASNTAVLEFLDTPASTSTLTYAIQTYAGGSENIFINESGGDTGSSTNIRGVSTITAIEVKS